MSSLIDSAEFEKILTKTVAPSKIRESLVDNEYLSDVIFRLANGEQLRAHKMFLITSGPIFHKLFSEHDEDVISVNLEWISKPTMLEVCRFIYSDILNIKETNMMEIWSVALKLEMKYLLEKTIDFICKSLNEKSVFQVLQTNLKHNDFRLNMKCFEFIQKNHKKCLQTEDFLHLPSDLLKIMLQTCKLPNNIAKEAAERWENNNSHEDIEELLSSLSLNEGSEEPEVESNDSDSDESTMSQVSKPDGTTSATKKKKNRGRNDRSGRNDRGGRNDRSGAAGGGRNGRGKQQPVFPNQMNIRPGNFNQFNHPGHPFPNQQFPNQPFPNQPFPMNQQFRMNQPFTNQQLLNHQLVNQQFPNRTYHKPKEQPKDQPKAIKHFAVNGPMVRKPFKFANLEIGIVNKNIAVKEIFFNNDLAATDKKFEIWISEIVNNKLEHTFNDKVSIEAGKVNGEFVRYILPKKNVILTANHKYWIRVEFVQDEFRQSYTNYSEVPGSGSDRIQIIRDQTLVETAQIISRVVYTDT